MKAPRILAATIASLLLASRAFAAIEIWDGGGANDNISTALNWIDDTAPASDIANTDLIFSGGTRLTPNVIGLFSTHSVIFDNVVSGAAVGFAIGGQQLNLGTGGILNSDSHTAQFSNTLNFSGVATSSINAGSGALYLFSNLTLPTGTLTVTGSSDTLIVGDISGTGTLSKTGAGTMSWTKEGLVGEPLDVSIDITVGSGTLSLGLSSLLPVVHSGATLAVNGGALNLDGGLTLDGGTLTRATGATLNLAAGKTLTVQNGGDVDMTGAFTNSTASTITVTGAGSSFTGSSTLAFGGPSGSTLNVFAGAAVTATGFNIGTGGDGTATVSGSGSSMNGGS
ncbi:MAG TPA: hypothetical protein VFD27_11310, partial [Chthoniobacteraceae bacterium]|nr:hypothetical protein [Chthoniobacteraceae bacterium]